MRQLKWGVVFFLSITVGLVANVHADVESPTVCGDLDGDGLNSIPDLAGYVWYMLYDSASYFDIYESQLLIGDQSDIDPYKGISLLDYLYFAQHLGADFRVLNCPSTGGPEPLPANDDYLFRHQRLAPSNVSNFSIPLYIDNSLPIASLLLPFRVLLDDVPAGIDSFVLTDVGQSDIYGNSNLSLAGIPTERVLMMSSVFANWDIYPAGLRKIGDLKISASPSLAKRQIELQPIRRAAALSPADTTLLPSVYRLVTGPPIDWIGYTPEVRNYLCGDNSGDGSVDIADLTSMVDFLFISFQNPVVPEALNVDGDHSGACDISDLTTLVNYLFAQGPMARC